MIQRYMFTGDVKLLKTIGYNFQKLYARNYKTYSKNRIIMYVTSQMMLELDDVKDKFRNKFIEFIIKNKNQTKEFWLQDNIINLKKEMIFKDMPIWIMTDLGNIMTNEEYNIKREPYSAKIYSTIKSKLDGDISDERCKEIIKKERDENPEFSKDIPMMFDDIIIAQIIELDNLHSLELNNVNT